MSLLIKKRPDAKHQGAVKYNAVPPEFRKRGTLGSVTGATVRLTLFSAALRADLRQRSGKLSPAVSSLNEHVRLLLLIYALMQ